MNTWQVSLQLRYLLRSRNWTGTSTTVFHDNSVRITISPELGAIRQLISPVALIRPQDAQSDPTHGEEPDFLTQNFSVVLIVVVPGDEIGENTLLGANVSGTNSLGRGLLQIEEELFAAIERLNDIDGVRIQSRARGATLAQLDDQSNYIAWREYQFEAIVTADRFYHPPITLAGTPSAGQVAFTWTNPPDRWDRYRVRLVRKSGSSAPTSIGDGTEVTLGSNLPTSFTNSGLAAGTYSYSLFSSYDETNTLAANAAAADDRTSDPVSVTALVVT